MNDRSIKPAAGTPGVLLVTAWYGGNSNGVALVVESLAQTLHRSGTSVAVLELVGDGWRPTLRRGTAGEEILTLCVRDPARATSLLHALAARVRTLVASRAIRRLVRRRALRVAHFHYTFEQFDIVRPIVAALGLPIVATFHGNDLGVSMRDPLIRAVTERLLRAAAVATTVSASLGRRLVETFPFVAPIARTVHNAIPGSIPHMLEEGAESERDIDVLFTGNLIPRKGVDVLLRALPQVCARYPALRVVVAGDGPERASLEALTSSLGLANAVTFVGRQDRDQAAQLFCRAHLSVVPSRAEPFGLVVVEAIAAGARVVASDVGGIPEIASKAGGVTLVAPDDPDALAASIIAAINDPHGAACAAEARARARVAFSPEAVCASYVDAYRAALGMECALPFG